MLFNIVNQDFLPHQMCSLKANQAFYLSVVHQQGNKNHQSRGIWYFKTGSMKIKEKEKNKKRVTESGCDEITETGMTEVVCKRNSD